MNSKKSLETFVGKYSIEIYNFNCNLKIYFLSTNGSLLIHMYICTHRHVYIHSISCLGKNMQNVLYLARLFQNLFDLT